MGARQVSRAAVGLATATILVLGGNFAFASLASATPGKPTVTGVVPAFGSTAGGSSVTINGTGFTGTATVSFGGTPATSTGLPGGTSMTAVTPAHAAGFVDVTVTTNGGTSAINESDHYTFGAVPAVTAAPIWSSGPTVGGQPVKFCGTNLAAATVVDFGTTSVPFVETTGGCQRIPGDDQIATTSPVAPYGVADITVLAPFGRSPTTSLDQFTTLPTITGLALASGTIPGGPAGPLTGGTALVVTGSGFSSTSPGLTSDVTSVYFGNTAITVPTGDYTVVSNTQIDVTTPSGLVGARAIHLTTALGTAFTHVATSNFSYDGLPKVSALSTKTGTASGGNTITVSGSYFCTGGATSVSFVGTSSTFSGTGVIVSSANGAISATSLQVTVPAAAVGVFDVEVTTPGGTSTATPGDRYTFS